MIDGHKLYLTNDDEYIKSIVINGNTITVIKSDDSSVTTTITASEPSQTIEEFLGATSSASGSSGLVPAPGIGDQDKYLKGDGSWASIDTITVDSALSSTSTNPVQNKVVDSAINQKLSLSGGTMTGALVVQNNTNYTTYQARNIAFATSASTPTGNGDILAVYS